ncbi:MAG: 5-formyltetrahydrofolate cyclo-ligase [Bacteroidetes bacterium]|nr:5-formyltetrahydrofolate cyclo-ligase [Bacteroidota bacterium]
MTKQALRHIFKEKRKELTLTQQAKLDDLLLIQLQKTTIPFIETLFTYWPVEAHKEPNTHLFTDYLEFINPGLRIAYPTTDTTTHEMKAIATDEQTSFVQTKWGLSEPESGPEISPAECDLVIVPLLAFDEDGYRVGYGKGYYDKFLSRCRPDCLKLGFSYFEPVAEIGDRADFDVPLNLCITPQTIYVF